MRLTFFHLGQAMHAGVERDVEQQRVKKERVADFQQQREMEAQYRKIQNVSDGASSKGGGESKSSGKN